MDTNTTELLHDLKKIVQLWNQVKVAMDDFVIHYLESAKKGVEYVNDNPDCNCGAGAGAGSGATHRIYKRAKKKARA